MEKNKKTMIWAVIMAYMMTPLALAYNSSIVNSSEDISPFEYPTKFFDVVGKSFSQTQPDIISYAGDWPLMMVWIILLLLVIKIFLGGRKG